MGSEHSYGVGWCKYLKCIANSQQLFNLLRPLQVKVQQRTSRSEPWFFSLQRGSPTVRGQKKTGPDVQASVLRVLN